MWPQCLPPNLGSIWLRVLEQIWFQDFRDAAFLDSQIEWFKQCWISMKLWCFSSSFGSIQPVRLGDVIWRISRWPLWRPSWISDQNNFSNSESLHHSDIWLMVWEMSFEEFQDGHYGGHLGYRIGTILAILNLYVTPISDLWFGRRCHFRNFKMAAVMAILAIRTELF